VLGQPLQIIRGVPFVKCSISGALDDINVISHGIKKAPDGGFVCFAVWTGFEPATSCVTGRHSNQLNYQTNILISIKNLFPNPKILLGLTNPSSPRLDDRQAFLAKG
jgi:hypothetical protein